jgi:hypothetical protein
MQFSMCHSFGFRMPVMRVDFSGVFTDQSVLPTAPYPQADDSIAYNEGKRKQFPPGGVSHCVVKENPSEKTAILDICVDA